MPSKKKLPDNFVKPPAFDNPLRRTTEPATPKPGLAVVETPEPAENKAPPAPAQEPQQSASKPDAEDAIEHRLTLRLTQPQWEAIQREVFERRISGQKTTAAELLREIVDSWRSSANSANS